jgi:hypothetical protein
VRDAHRYSKQEHHEVLGTRTLFTGRRMTEQLRHREGDQPLPIVNDYPFIHDLVIVDFERDRIAAGDATLDRVIEDVRGRKDLGTKRYGTALQPFNGRDVLRDFYEELLDAAAYFRQELYEHDISPMAGPLDRRHAMYKNIRALLLVTRKMRDSRNHIEQ